MESCPETVARPREPRPGAAVSVVTGLPTTTEVRVLRAAAFGGVAAGLADAAHRLAGHEPSPVVSLVGCLAAAWLVWPRTARSLSARRLVLTTVVLQWVLHAAFVLTGPSGHAHSAHSAHIAHMGVTAALAEMVPGASDPRMLAAHMTAAAVLALWVAVGERLVFRIAGLGLRRAVIAAACLVERVRAAGTVLAAVAAHVRDRRCTGICQRRAEWLRRERFRDALVEHTVVRRGPPGWRTVTTPRPRTSPARLRPVASA